MGISRCYMVFVVLFRMVGFVNDRVLVFVRIVIKVERIFCFRRVSVCRQYFFFLFWGRVVGVLGLLVIIYSCLVFFCLQGARILKVLISSREFTWSFSGIRFLISILIFVYLLLGVFFSRSRWLDILQMRKLAYV